jgi:hypothetical protein
MGQLLPNLDPQIVEVVRFVHYELGCRLLKFPWIAPVLSGGRVPAWYQKGLKFKPTGE